MDLKLIEAWAELRRSGWRPKPAPPNAWDWLWLIPIAMGVGLILLTVYT